MNFAVTIWRAGLITGALILPILTIATTIVIPKAIRRTHGLFFVLWGYLAVNWAYAAELLSKQGHDALLWTIGVSTLMAAWSNLAVWQLLLDVLRDAAHD
jgi:hypothetical protein